MYIPIYTPPLNTNTDVHRRARNVPTRYTDAVDLSVRVNTGGVILPVWDKPTGGSVLHKSSNQREFLLQGVLDPPKNTLREKEDAETAGVMKHRWNLTALSWNAW